MTMQHVQRYLELLLTTRPLLTVVALIVLLASNALLARAISRLAISLEQRRRARRLARAVVTIAGATIVLIIWAQKLKSVALIIGAFAVAIVIALRELFQALSGWTLKTSAASFRIGDRIVVGESSGEVIDSGLLSTTLVGRDGLQTGALISLPNSQYLSKPVRNDGGAGGFVSRSARVPVAHGKDWRGAKIVLAEAAEAVFAGYEGAAQQALAAFEKQHDSELAAARPNVYIAGIDDKGVQLDLVMLVPIAEASATIDGVLSRYLERLEALTPPAAEALAVPAAAGVTTSAGETTLEPAASSLPKGAEKTAMPDEPVRLDKPAEPSPSERPPPSEKPEPKT
jgi:small-conductance mechanosensitive channel